MAEITPYRVYVTQLERTSCVTKLSEIVNRPIRAQSEIMYGKIVEHLSTAGKLLALARKLFHPVASERDTTTSRRNDSHITELPLP